MRMKLNLKVLTGGLVLGLIGFAAQTWAASPHVAAGDRTSFSIHANGTLWAWGSNWNGALGDGSGNSQYSPVSISAGSGLHWVQVSAGYAHGLGLKSDGTIWGWGYNSSGQVGNNSTTSVTSGPVQIGSATDWVYIAAGYEHSFAINADGKLYGWGFNGSGTLGNGSTTDEDEPVQIGSATNWVAVSGGYDHSVGLQADGTVWTWGLNDYGQLGDGTNTDQTSPIEIHSSYRFDDWVSVSAGRNHTLALRANGDIYAWGDNDFGQLGNNSTTDSSTPVEIGSGSDWISIDAGDEHSVAIKADGSWWGWGNDEYGQLGLNDATFGYETTPTQILAYSLRGELSAGGHHSLGLSSAGDIWAWGSNNSFQLGDGRGAEIVKIYPTTVSNAGIGAVVTESGYDHSLAINASGVLWVWGSNSDGKLGVGLADTSMSYSEYVLEIEEYANGTPMGDWVAISGSSNHSLGIKADGSLWAWGQNTYGQLGDNSTTERDAPVKIGSATWRAIAAGEVSSFGIKTNGTLWAWGANGSGQLGDGTTTNRTSGPVQIGSDADWVAITSSDTGSDLFTIGLKADGSVYAWGDNTYGQLGDNSTADSTSPVQEDGADNDWVAISTGRDCSYALKVNGIRYGWGRNNVSQLGDGTTTNRQVPDSDSGTDWTKISGGDGFASALQADGGRFAWGVNDGGQLGNGTTTDEDEPVEIGSDYWVDISSTGHNIGIKANGVPYGWGPNDSGQLGDETTTDRTSPTAVADTVLYGYGL